MTIFGAVVLPLLGAFVPLFIFPAVCSSHAHGQREQFEKHVHTIGLRDRDVGRAEGEK